MTKRVPHFKIGITFSGKYRDQYVEPIVNELLILGFTKDDIFYDKWHEELINGVHGDSILRDIYQNKCDCVVVLLSPDYKNKNWTDHVEWPGILEKINTGEDENICLLGVDSVNIGEIEGLYNTQAIIKAIDNLEASKVAQFIKKKYEIVKLEDESLQLTNHANSDKIKEDGKAQTSTNIQNPTPKIISSKRLIDTIKESCDGTVRFCFILGSGASVSSGIKNGRELESIWMKCLLGEEDDGPARKRDKEETIKLAKTLYEEKQLKYDFEQILKDWEEGKELSSDYYYDIFTLRFYPELRNGDSYLERMMEGKDPSFGYYILSFFMEKYKQHNLVISTNFDSLMEEALYLLSTTRPLIVGHESLSKFITSDVHRPIIAKVNRSLFYEPVNSLKVMDSLLDGWSEALDFAFKTYTPIVIGSGGGNGALMTFLEEKVENMPNGIYWCYEGDKLPNEKVQAIVRKKRGVFVKIDGFDELMLEMGEALFGSAVRPESLERFWMDQTANRVNRYKTLLDEIKKKKSKSIQTIVKRMEEEERKEEQKRDEESKLTYWDYVNRADRAKETGDYETALQEWTNAIKERPDYSTAYNNRGYIYRQMNRIDDAIRDYTTAIKLQPDCAEAYYNRGSTYHYIGSYSEEIQDYSKAIELKPDYALAYNNRGYTYGKMGKFDKAFGDLNKAIELKPDFAKSYYNRGCIYDMMGQYIGAICDYTKAIELKPDYIDAYNNRGCSYCYIGKYEESIRDHTHNIKLNPDYTDAYNNRGYSYSKMGKYDEAIKDLTKAIELESVFANPHRHLGNIYYYQKKYQEAIMELSKAIELNEKYIEAYEDRARVYRRIGDYSSSEKDEEMAEKIKEKRFKN